MMALRTVTMAADVVKPSASAISLKGLPLPKPGMKAACLPGRQGGKGLPEPFHHQGAGGLLFPFRFFLHQNIFRGNELFREMVFYAGGSVRE